MSSCNYNDMLSPYHNKGTVGKPELFDTPEELDYKTGELYGYIVNSRGIVVLTGAGISTSSGIPDFRGPNGVWTLEKAGQQAGGINFLNAKPSYTHVFLREIEKIGKVDWLITQNIDDLHRKSGFPPKKTSELHGNLTKEQCDRCKRIVYRDFVISSVGFKPTGRKCEQENNKGRPCRGKFVDMTLDWDSELPKDDLDKCYEMLKNCELLICLGTSLEVLPVGDFPVFVAQNGGMVVSVNLQETKHEEIMKLAIHARVDDVCRILTDKMDMYIPEEPVPVIPEEPAPLPQSSSKRTLEDSEASNSAKRSRTEIVNETCPGSENSGSPSVALVENGAIDESGEKTLANSETKPVVHDVINLSDDDV